MFLPLFIVHGRTPSSAQGAQRRSLATRPASAVRSRTRLSRATWAFLRERLASALADIIDEHVPTRSKSSRFPCHGARDVALLGGEPRLRQVARAERAGSALVFPRRAHHSEQSHGRASRLGAVVERYVSALPRHERPVGALPEWLRLPGIVGRGRGRKEPWNPHQARDSRLRH